MESRVNYMITGAFVLLFGAALLGFVFWMGKYGYENRSFDLYKVYLDESVSGLNVESPVKFRGVKVGSVKSIKISKTYPDKIEVTLQIEKGTPIRENVLAMLGSQGITGLKYIEITADRNYREKNPPLIKKNKNGFGVIRPGKSFLGKLGDSATTIAEKADTLLKKLNILLKEKNMENFEKILENTENATAYVKDKTKDIDRVIEQIKNLLSDDNLKNAKSILKELKLVSREAKMLMAKIRSELKKGKFDLKKISEESLDHLDEVLEETKRTLRSAQNMVEDLQRSPSDIIFKSKEVKYGPGEDDED